MIFARLGPALTLAAGLLLGTLYGSHLHNQAGAASNPCKDPGPSAGGTNVVFATSSVIADDEQFETKSFSVQGPFTIRWSTQLVDASQSAGIFSARLSSAQQGRYISEGGIFVVPLNIQKPPRGSIAVNHTDCTSGCYFALHVKNVKYAIQVLH